MKVNLICNTDGKGLWSRTSKAVKVTSLELNGIHIDDGDGHAELCVGFSKGSWDIDKYGLIYTDNQWLKDLKKSLAKLGFSKKALKGLDYTEQGMQGDTYVSLDVDIPFVREFFVLGGKI